MGPGNLSDFVGQFKRVLSQRSINTLGRLTGFLSARAGHHPVSFGGELAGQLCDDPG